MGDRTKWIAQLTAGLVAGVLVVTACGAAARQAAKMRNEASPGPIATTPHVLPPIGSTSSSATNPRTAEPMSEASAARLASPPPDCVPTSSTRALSGPVAAYYFSWGDYDTCATITLIDGSGHTSSATSPITTQFYARFTCHVPEYAPYGVSGLVPGPAYSVSSDRVYWWDGHHILWLGKDGSQGSEALFVASADVGLEFAVSPDDSRMILTTIDYATWPLHRVTWIEDVATHAHRTTLFDADLSTDLNKVDGAGSAGWPWGWHAGKPVLFDYGLCIGLGGDQFIASHYPRLVDPVTGNWLVTFPECYGGTITQVGVFCTPSVTAHSLERYDWTGHLTATYPLSVDTIFCDSDASPSGNQVVAWCQRNIYTASAERPGGPGPQYLFGAGPALPPVPAFTNLRWLDDDLVLVTNGIDDSSGQHHSTVSIWSMSRQTVVAGPVVLPGWYSWVDPSPSRLQG